MLIAYLVSTTYFVLAMTVYYLIRRLGWRD